MFKKFLLLFCICLPIFSEVLTNGDTRFIGYVDMSSAPYVKLPIISTNPIGTGCTTEGAQVTSIVTLSTFICHGGLWTQQTFTATGAGAANGLATLGPDSLLTTSQIPSFGGDLQNTAGSKNISVIGVNGVTYPNNPGTNTVPIVTAPGVVTYESIPNNALANSGFIITTSGGISGAGTYHLGDTIHLGLGSLSVSTLSDGSQVVKNNQGNSYTSGLQDLSMGTLKIPISTSYSPVTAGLLGLNSTTLSLVYGDGSTTRSLPWINGTTPVPGNGVQWGPNGQLIDTGAPPGSGSGGGITALTNDISASGSGSVSATVNKVGGQSAANIAAVSAAFATPNTSNSTIKLTASAVVPLGQIPSGIDATKVGSGSITNTLFDDLIGLTGNIQTQLNSKITPNIATKTGAYTVTSSDYTLLANSSTAGFTITLPATPNSGEILNVKKVDSSANTVTINGNGKTIDGLSTLTINTQNQSYTLQYDGTGWYIL